MKTIIYYFSGTGNSLEVAKKLAERLDAELVGMASLKEGPVGEADAVVGLVFPVYMYRPPRLVAAFTRRLVKPKYLFSVAVMGGDAGDALPYTEKLLRRQGIEMNAGFLVAMPDNYIPFGGPPPEEKRAEMFQAAEGRIEEIGQIVKSRGARREPSPSWFKTRVYPGLWYALGYWAIPISDKGYRSTEKCNGCGVCVRVCPVGNITLEDKRPVWHNRCEQCMACIQWCKETAIELGKKSEGVPRYTNPHISRKQIVAQKTKPEALS